MIKIVLSGGPHTGKTTLLNKLREVSQLHERTAFVSEPATLVISEEQQKEKNSLLKPYQGIYPWNNYNEFSQLVIEKSLTLEKAIHSTATMAVLDRSLIDTIAYARLNQCGHVLPALYKLISQASYSIILFCDFVGGYENSIVRSESYDEAIEAHEALRAAYQEQAKLNGYHFIDVPGVPLTERLLLVTEIINAIN